MIMSSISSPSNRRIERNDGTTTSGTDTPTHAVAIATSVSASIEEVPLMPLMRPAMTTPATATNSESNDGTIDSNFHTAMASFPKKAGHHFYYVAPSSTKEHEEIPRSNKSGNDDRQQMQLSIRLQDDPNVRLAHDPPFTSNFPPSPMVTPPIHKGYTDGTSNREGTNMPTSTNQNIMFHRTSLSQQQQQQHLKSSLNHHATGVPHVYHDYISQGLWNDVDDENDTTFIRKKTGGVSQPFPEKLHEMLTTVEQTNEKDIVTWLPHGRAFIVRKPKEFTDYIMPKYFKQTKLTSFQRQLNLYGFRRLTQGADSGAYYHELFLRVRPNLCQRMTRQKVKGTGHKQPADAKTEPNFYEMSGSAVSSSSSFSQTTSVLNRSVISHPHPPSIPVQHERQGFDDLNDPIGQLQRQHIPHAYNSDEVTEKNIVSMATGGSHHTRIPVDSILDSPGLQCAAHLLQGIASGYRNSNLHIPTGDALATGGLDDGTGKEVVTFERSNDDKCKRMSTTFLQPRLSNEYR